MATGGYHDDVAAQRLLRITSVAEESLEFLAPIGGYAKLPLVSLEEAVEPLESILPDVQSHAYIAKQKCKKPADDLTQDESAAIMLYTMSWEPMDECLYFALNHTLRIPTADRQQKLKQWHPYLRLFLNALFRLPTTHTIAYRGVTLDLTSKYIKGETIVWWGFSSCTTDVEVLQAELFLGDKGARTMFTLECETARNIRKHSFFPVEEEVLLLAATKFHVNGCLRQGDLRIVQLKEITKPPSLLQPIPNVFPPIKPLPTGNLTLISFLVLSHFTLSNICVFHHATYLSFVTIFPLFLNS